MNILSACIATCAVAVVVVAAAAVVAVVVVMAEMVVLIGTKLQLAVWKGCWYCEGFLRQWGIHTECMYCN